MNLRNNKYKDLFKKVNITFIIIGVLSILLRTQMISYGLRYVRYNSELLFNNNSYNLYYDKIITYDSSKNFKNEYIIESNKSCTEYMDDDEINKDPCEIIFLDKEDASLHFSINNYMGKVEYKINEDD